MIGITVEDAEGNERTYAQIRSLGPLQRRAIRAGWFTLGKLWRETANREILHGVKSGRLYIIRQPSGRRRRHRASAPGQSHANLSGQLRRSLSWQVNSYRSLTVGYGISTRPADDAPVYAPFVELGTRKMEPRPSIGNAVDASQRNAVTSFEEAMRKALAA